MTNSFSLPKKINSPFLFNITKALLFLKKSFLISFIFATILYILMRVFFIGVDFSTAESIELYVKTLLITCFYINAWRVICLGIIWIEVKTTKVKFKGVINMPLMKRVAILIILAGFAYTVKANPTSYTNNKCVVETEQVKTHDIIPQFYLWTK